MTFHKLPLTLLLTIVIVSASYTMLVPEAQAGSGLTLSAYTSTPPTIDGNIQAAEWSSAATATFGPVGPGITGKLYMMNDGTNLYMAISIDGDADLGTNDVVHFQFDNNHVAGAQHQVGDDRLQAVGTLGLTDIYYSSPVTFLSDLTAPGGTKDGQAASARQGSSNHFELSHPLDDADDAHDFSLSAGQTVGFELFLNVNGVGLDLQAYNLGRGGEPSTFANYIVASARTLPPSPRPVGGVVAPTSKFQIVAPYAALAGLLVAVSAVVVVKKRRE